MPAKPFFDTNILIYALTVDEDPRSARARELLIAGGLVSVHVLNELVNALRRKFGKPWAEVLEAMADIAVFCPFPAAITITTHTTALAIAQHYGYGIYDSLVIAAALEASADTLYSEDLHAGQVIEGLRIVNPFWK